MIKIFSSCDEYKNDIISLWKACFGDSEDYVEFFLDNCPDYVCVGYFSDKRLVSMLFLLDGKIQDFKCKYLYAACTDKSYRRQGIMEKLIDAAKSYCKDLGYSGIFLVPANEKLYSYYAKFGFLSSFFKRKLKLAQQNNVKFQMEEIVDIEKIVCIKKRLLENFKAFFFEDKVIKYTIEEHLFNSGVVLYGNDNEKEALAFVYISDNKEILVKELLADFDESLFSFEKLFSKYSNENIYICAPIVYNSKDKVEEYTKCGMCFPLNSDLAEFLTVNKKIYAGMYLD